MWWEPSRCGTLWQASYRFDERPQNKTGIKISSKSRRAGLVVRRPSQLRSQETAHDYIVKVAISQDYKNSPLRAI